MTISSADSLYALAASWTGENVLVEHELVEHFSAGVSKLLSGLGDELDDGYWAMVRRPLRGLRWRLATVPLPFDSAVIGLGAAAEAAIPRLRRCPEVAPERTTDAASLIAVLEELVKCSDNPLGEAVAVSLHGSYDPAILLIDGYAAPAVAEAFPGVRVMSAAELMRGRAGTVAAVGSSVWFPLRIQQAPRAEHLNFVRYSWIGDRVRDLALIDGSAAHLRQGFTAGRVRPPREEERPVPPEDLMPKFEWGAISRRARERSAAEPSGEPVEARLFLLASRQGVYLQSGDDRRTYVADVDEEITVSQEQIKRLTAGRFLVLRTAGEGDYVELYADQLLGARAENLRAAQGHIRSKLHEYVLHMGLAATAQVLRRYGSRIANEANVRNWIDPEHIRTRDFADFEAICRLIGEPDAEQLFAAMGEIYNAHRRAGIEIRRLLVEELRHADLGSLLRDGWGEYDVAEIEGEGSLLVARIVDVAPDAASVPRTRLRKPFGIEDDLWLG